MTSSPYDGMTAVLYARVSTDDKDQRPEAQMHAMEQWAERNHVIVVGNGRFIEEKSGKDMDRPQFQACIGRIFAGAMNTAPVAPESGTSRVNLLVAWHSSRISRDVADFANIKRQIEALGTRMVFVANDMDTTSDMGGLMVTIESALNQLERKKIAENTKMGMRQSRYNGQHLGRPLRVVVEEDIPSLPYHGMVRTDDGVKHKTKIVPERDLWAWASEGLTVPVVAKDKLYIPYRTLRDCLVNTGRYARYEAILWDATRGKYGKPLGFLALDDDKGSPAPIAESTPLSPSEGDHA